MPVAPDRYAPTPRTTPTRDNGRVTYDRELVHGILDSEYLCHVGFVADTAPVVLPTLYARVEDRLYLHGSSGSRLMLLAREGVAVCVTVTCLDGLVLARSARHHSANYRSVVVHGTAHRVSEEREARLAVDRIVDHAVPGRAADIRPPSAKELAATGVLRLDIAEVSAKVRSGGVNEEPEDLDLPHWAGVLPLRRSVGAPRPDPKMPDDVALPAYLEHYTTG
ncbi:hypothetical protein LP52_09360 [Streptomonospora alba]|uniref:Flavin-nucleotide-binding protein n=1 Tax=Streptomonospora alba TaxID=183763 RepID=A0A0C2JCC9_9ACTN|nr:pyridoxamine 5'-phosphate oxidase family protein [Streptomonospora alba]KIH99061.1 hypothetical protein LP52_09360 [Streptomonospora alba]